MISSDLSADGRLAERRDEKQKSGRPIRHRGAFVPVVHVDESQVAECWIPAADRMTETDSGWNVKAQHLEKYLILKIHLNPLILHSLSIWCSSVYYVGSSCTKQL